MTVALGALGLAAVTFIAAIARVVRQDTLRVRGQLALNDERFDAPTPRPAALSSTRMSGKPRTGLEASVAARVGVTDLAGGASAHAADGRDRAERADAAAEAVRAFLLARGWCPAPVTSHLTARVDCSTASPGDERGPAATHAEPAHRWSSPSGADVVLPLAVLPGTQRWNELLTAIAAAERLTPRGVERALASLAPPAAADRTAP